MSRNIHRTSRTWILSATERFPRKNIVCNGEVPAQEHCLLPRARTLSATERFPRKNIVCNGEVPAQESVCNGEVLAQESCLQRRGSRARIFSRARILSAMERFLAAKESCLQWRGSSATERFLRKNPLRNGEVPAQESCPQRRGSCARILSATVRFLRKTPVCNGEVPEHKSCRHRKHCLQGKAFTQETCPAQEPSLQRNKFPHKNFYKYGVRRGCYLSIDSTFVPLYILCNIWGVAKLYCSALFSQVSRCLRQVCFTPFNLLEQENSQIYVDLFFSTIVEQLKCVCDNHDRPIHVKLYWVGFVILIRQPYKY